MSDTPPAHRSGRKRDPDSLSGRLRAMAVGATEEFEQHAQNVRWIVRQVRRRHMPDGRWAVKQVGRSSTVTRLA